MNHQTRDEGGCSVSWTVGGNIAVDDTHEDQPRMEIKFFEPWDRLSYAKKVRLVHALLDYLPIPDDATA